MDIKHFSKALIEYGIQVNAQDLYILPEGAGFTIFFRKASLKHVVKKVNQAVGERLIFHFKFLGEMDVGEKRKAQVGAVTYECLGKKRRLRLSSVGDFRQRESLVIRFLHQFGETPEHYLLPCQVARIEWQVKKRGLYLFCGAVGSGKTTFMYKLAKKMAVDQQVISVEDPVEVEEDAFLQLQTNEKIHLNYDSLIKVCLRHRPDVLIIGEIRDEQTAQATIRAALTGHTVFTTIHAKDTAGVYARLNELGVSKTEIQECVKGVIYQRMLVLPATVTNLKQGTLFAYQFSNAVSMTWEQSLRKAWGYGIIDEERFQKERED